MPVVATRLAAYPANCDGEQVLAADLRPGEVVLVRPGETIPADGQVIEGVSSANEALLTGESAPVGKRPGVAVTGGAVNIESPLLIEVTQVGNGTRLSAIVRLMERAATEKPANR
jgi:Cu2+-exporting ATPase